MSVCKIISRAICPRNIFWSTSSSWTRCCLRAALHVKSTLCMHHACARCIVHPDPRLCHTREPLDTQLQEAWANTDRHALTCNNVKACAIASRLRTTTRLMSPFFISSAHPSVTGICIHVEAAAHNKAIVAHRAYVSLCWLWWGKHGMQCSSCMPCFA